MFSCEKCGKFFRDKYNFKSHQSRVKPCVKENNVNKIPLMTDFSNLVPNTTSTVPNTTSTVPNTTSTVPNTTSTVPNTTFSSENNTCKYCLHTFNHIGTKNRHLLICKYRDDPIRNLEIENDIIPELPESSTECRFCNKVFCRIDVLNKHITICKEREIYHKILIKEKEQKVNNITINNNCNNTTNINNKLILNFGQENLNHLQTENIINLIRDIRKEFGNDQVYLMAGNLITSFDNYIRLPPENNNLRIPDSKSLYAEVRIPGGWEKTPVDRSLNKAFKKSANELYNKKEEINNYNERVFASEKNQEIFSEVKHFKDKGFNYGAGEELRKVQTGFKVSKLKNKVENDLDF